MKKEARIVFSMLKSLGIDHQVCLSEQSNVRKAMKMCSTGLVTWDTGVSVDYCIAKNFRQPKISSEATVRRLVRNLFSSNVGYRLLLFDRSVVLLLFVDFHIHEYF